MDELPAEAPDHLVGLVAVDRGARGRDVLDAPVGRQAADDVRRVLREEAEELLALAQRFEQHALVRGVLADGRDPRRPAVLHADGLRAGPDPARLAVGADDAVLEVGRLGHLVAQRGDRVAVVGMQEVLRARGDRGR